MSIVVVPFVEPLGYCSDISYQVMYSNGSSLNNTFITFVANETKFIVYTEDMAAINKSPYSLKIIG